MHLSPKRIVALSSTIILLATTACIPLPPPPSGPNLGTVAVTTGTSHTCSIEQNSLKNIALCWGSNGTGQLGNDVNVATMEPNPVPTQVRGLKRPIAISAGEQHTCAIERVANTNTAMCWGNNYSGQLGNTDKLGDESGMGDGTATALATTTPTAVVGVTNPVAIATGAQHTCAIEGAETNDGSNALKCWGNNRYGQLGSDPATGTDMPNPEPTAVSGLKNPVEVAAAATHTCVVDEADGERSVLCFGSNFAGQLGTNTNVGGLVAQPVPTTVLGLNNPAKLHVSPQQTCVIDTADNTTDPKRGEPATISSSSVAKCWGLETTTSPGDNEDVAPAVPQTSPKVVPYLKEPSAIITSAAHSCAIDTTTTNSAPEDVVVCWGRNFLGQLGRDDSRSIVWQFHPEVVTRVTNPIAISGGPGGHTCAIQDVDGPNTVTCWGQNDFGQIGTAT